MNQDQQNAGDGRQGRETQGNAEDEDFTDLGWRPQDIGYFDPKLDESHGKGDCVMVRTNTYWRIVYMFVD
jgi:hypothetical protein